MIALVADSQGYTENFSFLHSRAPDLHTERKERTCIMYMYNFVCMVVGINLCIFRGVGPMIDSLDYCPSNLAEKSFVSCVQVQ